jgi:hypothetical protein
LKERPATTNDPQNHARQPRKTILAKNATPVRHVRDAAGVHHRRDWLSDANYARKIVERLWPASLLLRVRSQVPGCRMRLFSFAIAAA